MSWTLVNRGSSRPVLRMCTYPPCTQRELRSRTRLSESNVSLRPSGQYTWLNPAKASNKLLRLWRAGVEITHLTAYKTCLLCKFPCLLTLPPTNLEWSAAFFFSHSLPPCMGAGLQSNTPGSQDHTAGKEHSWAISYGCYRTTLGSVHRCTVKPIYWHRGVVKESAAFIVRCQTRSLGQIKLKKAWTPQWVSEKDF